MRLKKTLDFSATNIIFYTKKTLIWSQLCLLLVPHSYLKFVIVLQKLNNTSHLQAGTVNTAPWRDAPATATTTVSARPTRTWSGNVGASPDGSDPVATSTWSRIAPTGRTMTKVSPMLEVVGSSRRASGCEL